MLKVSRGVRARLAGVVGVHHDATAGHAKDDHLQLFREVNDLARKGLWNPVENQPRRLQWPGLDKSRAYRVFHRMTRPDEQFQRTSPYAPIAFAALLAGVGWAMFYVPGKIYELVVPEERRLQYKYRHLHGHGHEHGHGHGQGHHGEHH